MGSGSNHRPKMAAPRHVNASRSGADHRPKMAAPPHVNASDQRHLMRAALNETPSAKRSNQRVCCGRQGNDGHSLQELNMEEEPGLLQWGAVTPEFIQALMDRTLEEVLGSLAEVLGFGLRRSCGKELVLLDYYVSGFWWAKLSGFSPTQVSFSMAVFQRLLDNIRDKGVDLLDNWRALALTLNAAIQPALEEERAPVLTAEQAMALSEYVTNSLFHHYRLYELLFTSPREQALLAMDGTVEVVGEDAIAPLEEGSSAERSSQGEEEEEEEEEEEAGQEETRLEPQEGNPEEAQSGEETAEEGLGVGAWSIQEVEEVIADLAPEMLGSLQADFIEKLRLLERSYTMKIGNPNSTSK